MSAPDPGRRAPRRQGRPKQRPRLPREGVTATQPQLVADGTPVQKVRKPGAMLNITGDALRDVEDPKILQLLTPEQRVLRRKLRAMESKRRTQVRKALAKRQNRRRYLSASRLCTHIKDNDEPCNGWKVYGSDKCIQHIDEEDRVRLEIPKLNPPRGSKKAKAPEVMRQVVEAAVAKILEPYFTALGIEFAGYDEATGEPVIVTKGRGIMIHGESKDGDIVMTNYQNVTAMVAVAERLLDRVYGKARQTTVLEGGASPIKVSPVRSEERAQEVASILARSRAIPPEHSGRQRRSASTPTDPSAHVPQSETADE